MSFSKTLYMRVYTRKHKERINAQRRARRKLTHARILAREKAWRLANHGKVLTYKKKDRTVRAEKYKEWKKTWAKKHSAEIRSKRAIEYKQNKEVINARLKAFRINNPEKYNLCRVLGSQRRRARLANVEQEIINRDLIFQRDHQICGICGKVVEKKDFSLDHIIPISLGGPHTMVNLQTAHLNCNRAKGNRIQPVAC